MHAELYKAPHVPRVIEVWCSSRCLTHRPHTAIFLYVSLRGCLFWTEVIVRSLVAVFRAFAEVLNCMYIHVSWLAMAHKYCTCVICM